MDREGGEGERGTKTKKGEEKENRRDERSVCVGVRERERLYYKLIQQTVVLKCKQENGAEL